MSELLYAASSAVVLGFRRGKTPSASSIGRTLAMLDAQQFEAALSRWVASRIGSDPQLLCLDGKTLRGSRDGQLPGQHLVSLYAPQTQAVLVQMRVDAKTNEHKAALALLGLVKLTAKVVTGDAMFCQRDLAQQVKDQGGEYVLIVKDNQPALQTDIQAGFAHEHTARQIVAATSPCEHAYNHTSS